MWWIFWRHSNVYVENCLLSGGLHPIAVAISLFTAFSKQTHLLATPILAVSVMALVGH